MTIGSSAEMRSLRRFLGVSKMLLSQNSRIIRSWRDPACFGALGVKIRRVAAKFNCVENLASIDSEICFL